MNAEMLARLRDEVPQIRRTTARWREAERHARECAERDRRAVQAVCAASEETRRDHTQLAVRIATATRPIAASPYELPSVIGVGRIATLDLDAGRPLPPESHDWRATRIAAIELD